MNDDAMYLHIFPARSDGSTTHCTDKTGMCGCKPDHKQVCSESNDHGQCKATCWRCKGTGLIDVYDLDIPTLVVHKENGAPVNQRPDWPMRTGESFA